MGFFWQQPHIEDDYLRNTTSEEIFHKLFFVLSLHTLPIWGPLSLPLRPSQLPLGPWGDLSSFKVTPSSLQRPLSSRREPLEPWGSFRPFEGLLAHFRVLAALFLRPSQLFPNCLCLSCLWSPPSRLCGPLVTVISPYRAAALLLSKQLEIHLRWI